MITPTDLNTNLALGGSGTAIGYTVDNTIIAYLSIAILCLTLLRAVYRALYERKRLKQFDICKNCKTYKEMLNGKD